MALPAGFDPIDFVRFHREALVPWAAGERGMTAGRAAQDLAPLAIVVGEVAFTYRVRDGRVAIEAGDAAATDAIELDADAWQGFVHELEAPAGLLYAHRVQVRRGEGLAFMAWETPLRALYHGRTPYAAAMARLADRHGRPLDVERAFTLDDDPEDIAHFLRVAGYLFVRGVFAADEIAAMAAEVELLRGEARRGDGLSWWGRRGDEDVLCRVTRGCTRPQLAALRTDPRLLRIVDLADETLVHQPGEGDGVAVIFKHPGMTEGLGDLPWHRDCGMGGHAVICPRAIASVFLTAGTPATGELTFLPGSRHAAFNGHDPAWRDGLPAAHFAAQPGDVTFHYGDTVHGAPPPADAAAGAYRVSAILGYGCSGARHHRGESSYNAVLHQRDDGQVPHLVELTRAKG